MRILNPLLYLTSAVLLGSAAMSFYEALPANGAIQGGGPDLPALRRRALEKSAELIQRGRATKAPQTNWNYNNLSWWRTFVEANFTGKLPPEPVETAGREEEEEVKAPRPEERPLDEIIAMVAMLYEQTSDGPEDAGDGSGGAAGDTGAGDDGAGDAGAAEPEGQSQQQGQDEGQGQLAQAGEEGQADGETTDPEGDPDRDPLMRPEIADHTQVVVRYTPESGVKPPEPPVAQTATNAVNQARRGGRNMGRGGIQSGVPGGIAQVTQTLTIGDSLYPPFEYIRLVRVAPDARSAFFVRSLPGPDGEGTVDQPPEELFKGELGTNSISQEALRALVEARRRATGEPMREVRSDPEPARGSSSRWVDVPQTRQERPGEWNISRSDSDTLQRDPNRLLSEVGLSSYKSGNVRGVQVNNVSPEISTRFGVNAGDVILSVNGTEVTSRSNAINVGRQEYDRGVRDFRVEVLTATGRTETRTYRVPPE